MNADLVFGAWVLVQRMTAVVKEVTCEIKICLGLPASVHSLQSASTNSQSEGLLGPSELLGSVEKVTCPVWGHQALPSSQLLTLHPGPAVFLLLFLAGGFSLPSGPSYRPSPLSQALVLCLGNP